MLEFCLYYYFCLILFFSSLVFFLLSFLFLSVDYFFLLDWELLSINSCSLVMTLVFDWMSCLFTGVVFFISSMVVYYSKSYMENDLYKVRFLLLVIMFVFSMFMMIMSPNMISILIGWDGLGLVSYCLVIYFQNSKSYSAGMLTILTNRLGDVAILLSIAWMLNWGSWHMLYYVFFMDSWVFYLLPLLVLAGFTSSAQIPFSSWLPAAMAAPTPVSALVHSSTLVTAGVYLLIRFNSLFMFYNCWILVFVSLMTMFMAGIGACFEYDLKKIIALSTLSQLGLMMSILFLGYPILSFYHLLTHAFFKALLFLSAGLIIHCMSDSQDIRHMGGVLNYLPMTCSCFCISNLALCGVPFLSGFYSKDLIVEVYSMSGFNLLFYFIYYISIGLTVSYSLRLIYYCLSNGNNNYVCQSYFEDFNMIFSQGCLSIMAVISGSTLSWLLFSCPYVLIMTFSMKIFSLLMVVVGGWLGYELSYGMFYFVSFSESNYNLANFLGSMWFMPKFSTYVISGPTLMLSDQFSDLMDMGWGEKVFSKYSLMFFIFMGNISSFFHYNSFKLFLSASLFFSLLFMI